MDAIGAPGPLSERIRDSRLGRWVFQPRGAEREVVLHHRRIFVLPTISGLVFVATLIALLIASMNYQLSLGYLLTFMIGATSWAGLHLTFANLSALRLTGVRALPTFAGEIAAFEVEVADTRRRARYALRLASQAREIVVHVAPDSARRVTIECIATHRGWLAAPRATLWTTFPLGLWRGWAYWRPALQCLIYPHPEADAPALPTTSTIGPEDGAGGRGDDSVAALRPYVAGDPARLIAWKSFAKSGGDALATKLLEGSSTGELWLDLSQTPEHFDIESRLSRLTAWVIAAHAAQIDFGLRVGQRSITPSRGDAHRDACLECLALTEIGR